MTRRTRAIALAAACLLGASGVAGAQATAPERLSDLEVQLLADTEIPSARLRLAAHFRALAADYDAAAARHRGVAATAPGWPLRAPGAAAAAAARQTHRAEADTETAVALRALAAYYEGAANGRQVEFPRGGAPFAGGAGARQPTEREIRAFAAAARTPADHRSLEEYFLTRSERFTTEADAYTTAAQALRGTRIAQAADHCERRATAARAAARQALGRATMHGALAELPTAR